MSEPEIDKAKMLAKRLTAVEACMEWDLAMLATNPANPMLRSTDKLLAYIGLLLLDIRTELRKTDASA